MTKNPILIISSILVLPFNLLICGIASANLGARNGFILGCVFYWLYVSLIVLLLNKGDFYRFRKIFSSSDKFQHAGLLKIAVFLPPIGVFFALFMPNIENLTLKTGLIILGLAIINGTVEEIYWRGLYLKSCQENPYIILVVSPLLFALMHFSFLAVSGINYPGGGLALVGGAFLMGLLWSYVSFKLNTIRYCIASHIFVNVFAFTGLFVKNGLQFF